MLRAFLHTFSKNTLCTWGGATSGGDSSAAVFPFSRLENGGFGGEVAMKNVPGVGATPGPSQ